MKENNTILATKLTHDFNDFMVISSSSAFSGEDNVLLGFCKNYFDNCPCEKLVSYWENLLLRIL